MVTCPAWIEWDSGGIEPHNSGEIRMGIEPRADRSRSVVSDVVWEHVDAVAVVIRADPVPVTTDRNPAKSRMDFEKISNRDLAVELGFSSPVVVSGFDLRLPPSPNC